MKNEKIIEQINAVIAEYFVAHKEQKIPAKDLMPEFIKAKIFKANSADGLPIRKLLRELDKANTLYLIPYVYAERKEKNTNWFFIDRTRSSTIALKQNKAPIQVDKSPNKNSRDEDYVIEICDTLLGQKSLRQHRFDFLRGDTGRKLPVDAYYPLLNVVIEYRERQHTESVKFWNKKTASGITRDEQRARYDQRRRDLLPLYNIRLIEISYSDFQYNNQKRLCRVYEKDVETITKILKIHSLL